MTDKELHKLGRRDLLQLLLQQGREAEELRQQLTETEEQLHQLEENYERLRKRLDQKDEQIHQLRDTLEEERTKREIKLEKAGSIAEAALRLNGIFEAAQSAADQYLHNIKLLQNGEGIEVSGRQQEIYDIQAEVVSEEAAEPVAKEIKEKLPEPIVEEIKEKLPAAEPEKQIVEETEAKPLMATEMYRIRKEAAEGTLVPETVRPQDEKESGGIREKKSSIDREAMALKRQQGWRTLPPPTAKTVDKENGMFHGQSGLRRASS